MRVIGTDRGDESSVGDILFMDKKTCRSRRRDQNIAPSNRSLRVVDSFDIDLEFARQLRRENPGCREV